MDKSALFFDLTVVIFLIVNMWVFGLFKEKKDD